MHRYDNNSQLKAALEKKLGGPITEDLFNELTAVRYPPYSDLDLQDIIKELGLAPAKLTRKELAQVIREIAEEVTLLQEIRLNEIEPALRQARGNVFKVTEGNIDEATAFLARFFGNQEPAIRTAYVTLFFQAHISPNDLELYIVTMKPNPPERFLVLVAFVMNQAYLSAREAMYYILTGQRTIEMGIFNPSQALMMHHLIHYLQPGGRPVRSLLSAKEKALLHFVYTTEGPLKPTILWPRWNQQYPQWPYDNWRFFWKALKRAEKRLLADYVMAFEAEYMQKKDPDHFWQKWSGIAKGLGA